MIDTNQTRNIVQLFLQLLTERNIERIAGLFSENIDWYIPGNKEKASWLGRKKQTGSKGVL